MLRSKASTVEISQEKKPLVAIFGGKVCMFFFSQLHSTTQEKAL